MFTSKELYIMNGGNKTYIGKDGYADVYSATADEEKEWAKEIIAKALETLNKEENSVTLQFAIENLRFHEYDGLNELLINKMRDTNPARRKVFADAIAGIRCY